MVQAQGVPVIDVANLVQSIEAVAQLKQQLQSQTALLQSLTGARGMGTMYNDPSLANYVPPDWRARYAAVRTRGYAGLSPAAQQFRRSTSIFDCAAKSGAALDLCNHELNKNAQDAAYLNQAYDQAQSRFAELVRLRGQIDASADAKATSDLNARLAEETAVVMNEQAKLQLYKSMSDTEDRLIAQQKHELAMKRLEATGSGMHALSIPGQN
jgi:type IV secretion system protein VirB5